MLNEKQISIELDVDDIKTENSKQVTGVTSKGCCRN